MIEGTSHRYPDSRKLPRDSVRIGCDRSQVSSVFPAHSSSPSPDNELPFELTRKGGVIHRTRASRLRRKLTKNPVRVGYVGCCLFPVPSSSPSLDNQVPFELTQRPFPNTGVSLSSAETPRDPVRVCCDGSGLFSLLLPPHRHR